MSMATNQVTVFVASSKKFYQDARRLCDSLRASGYRVFHPYFDRDQDAIERDPHVKAAVMREHFPEIDASDALYAFIPNGYAGISVAIEMSYAFAKGKLVLVSEEPADGLYARWRLPPLVRATSRNSSRGTRDGSTRPQLRVRPAEAGRPTGPPRLARSPHP
jgi:nucleoside 2-deoxyribosyltransferase